MSQLTFDLRPSSEEGLLGGGPVYTVSQINALVRERLQREFPDVWIEGEISNFRPYSSGHWYFTLKDEGSQIQAVMFQGRNRSCRFEPRDGLHVLARGRLELYMARGAFQVVVEALEPKGLGALQLAFQQLKEKLGREGLFDRPKRPLPLLPRRVGVVTSKDGAAIRDILRVIRRRYANLEVVLSPCRVQGEGAAEGIVSALRLLEEHGSPDVVIVGRGGGSIEDLWAFNEEAVARAICRCPVPVISAVGHETDVTIADLVADLRAPTPSAAAEQVVGRKEDLRRAVEGELRRAAQSVRIVLGSAHRRYARLETSRVFDAFRHRLQTLSQRLDDLSASQASCVRGRIDRLRARSDGLARRLSPAGLRAHVRHRRERLARAFRSLERAAAGRLARSGRRLERAGASLEALSPLAVLRRGYSLVRLDGRVVKKAREVASGDEIGILTGEGTIAAVVREVRPDDTLPRPSVPGRGGRARGVSSGGE